MIEIIEESYNREEDLTEIRVRFSHNNLGIDYRISRNGRLTEQEMQDFAQEKYDEWISRTS